VHSLGGRLASVVIGVATVIVIIAIAILPFLTPQWVGFEQGRAQADAWTGYSTAELREATDAILSDLVFGPPDFDVSVAGRPVLEAREQAHMRDVRNVFVALWVAAAVSVVMLVYAGARMRDRARLWRSIRRGAMVLAVGVVALGGVALVAFDTLFEVFHEIFFPAGSYTFDPRADKLVQLFPFSFWDETALVAGIVIVAISAVVAFVANRRERRAIPVTPPSEAVAPAPVPS
jgi:integral membrane protein (TIGR01906 family)